MRKILLAALFAHTALFLFAQNSTGGRGPLMVPGAAPGYYVKDGVVYNAYIYKEGPSVLAKSVQIPAQPGHRAELFSPEDISEYGFIDGRVRYVSARIETQSGYEWFFLEELMEIDERTSILYISNLYFPQDTYFLMEDGDIRSIATGNEPGEFWEFLYSLNDCKQWDQRVKYPSRLKKGVIKRYYNAFAYCNEKVFPKTRLGVTASVGFGKPVINDYRTGMSDPVILVGDRGYYYRYNVSFSAGAFFRLPIEEVVSLQTEVLYFHQSTGLLTSKSTLPFECEINTIRLPVLFRFNDNYSRKNLMAYAELGPCFDFNFGYYNVYYRGTGQSGKTDLPLFALGVVVGGGAEYYISRSRAAYLGVRFSLARNFNGSYKYNHRAFELVAGFSLF